MITELLTNLITEKLDTGNENSLLIIFLQIGSALRVIFFVLALQTEKRPHGVNPYTSLLLPPKFHRTRTLMT